MEESRVPSIPVPHLRLAWTVLVGLVTVFGGVLAWIHDDLEDEILLAKTELATQIEGRVEELDEKISAVSQRAAPKNENQEIQPAKDSAPIEAEAFPQTERETPAAASEQQVFALLGSGPWNGPQEIELRAGATSVFQVSLQEGLEYAIHGTCDADCDLAVHDSAGEMVGTDDALDFVPVVRLEPDQSGVFDVEVSCPGDACRALIRTEETRLGVLAEDEATSIAVRLEAGTEYRLSGLCDEDCGDLDLVLRDPQGQTVVEDVLPDALPVLMFEPDEDGEFELAVTMYECSVEPCVFTVLASLGN